MKFYLTDINQLCCSMLLLCCLLLACRPEQKKEVPAPSIPTLFELVNPATSGVKFVNSLPESNTMNSFLYEYYYNGGGVAIGDINNDGLDDIYFTSNLQDNALYLNEGDMKFRNISRTAGVTGKEGWATGVAMADVNGDGLLDIYVCRSGRYTDDNKRKNELFINLGPLKNGVPHFSEQAAKYGLDLAASSTQASFFDFDRDGDLDVFMANHNIETAPVNIGEMTRLRNTKSKLAGNQLLRNDDGIFRDITETAGIDDHLMNYALGVSVGDVNNDQWPDIYVAVDYGGADHLYLNRQNGTFRDVIRKATGHIPLASMGTDMADINNDGLADIMTLDMASTNHYSAMTSISGLTQKQHDAYIREGFHVQYSYNALQLNNGITSDGVPLFADIAHFAGIAATDWSWSPLLADYNNDGLNDLFISNGVLRDFINMDFNNSVQKEMDEVKDSGKNPLTYFKKWTEMSPKRSAPNFLFINNGDLSFDDQSSALGSDTPTNSNGAAYADLDNDGDLDLVVNNINSTAMIYANRSEVNPAHNYLSVTLKGRGKNTFGIGAKVMIYTKAGMQVRWQFPVREYQSSVSSVLHFGLKEMTTIDSLLIIWPDGSSQKLRQVPANQRLVLQQKDARQNDTFMDFKAFFDENIQPVNFEHREHNFDDFARQTMLPYKLSDPGPPVAVGDINGDGLDDVFIGGATGQAGQIFVQQIDGTLQAVEMPAIAQDRNYEDAAALFFDADGDGDDDLYIGSGGIEKPIGSDEYTDRLYENDHGRFVRCKNALPAFTASTGCVATADFDGDGDVDIFVGGRVVPGRYPLPADSYLLRNDSQPGELKFTDVTTAIARQLQRLGLVTDACWADIDSDKKPELIVAGEWMPISIFKNEGGQFKNITTSAGLSSDIGWWQCIKPLDADGDGDLDLVAGNIGLNFNYKVNETHPLEIYSADFDKNGTYDIVWGIHENGQIYPPNNRKNASTQHPFIQDKFKTNDAYARASLDDIYGKENLDQALHFSANNFASCYFENLGGGKFSIRPLPPLAQLSAVNNLEITDLNGDGFADLVLTGNQYQTESYTTRPDACYGWQLPGDGSGHFRPEPGAPLSMGIIGQVNSTALLKIADTTYLFAGINNARARMIKLTTGR